MLQVAFEGGFASPVFNAQAAFRIVMDAMARPGSLHRFPALAHPPAPLDPVAGALVLTLCDADTPVWLDAGLARARTVVDWIAFHTSAPVVADKAEAVFAIVSDASQMPDLSRFAQGSQDYPDRSTTVILSVNQLDGGAPLDLAGPGIKGTVAFSPNPMPTLFRHHWAENRARFPRGVDLIFAGGEAVACLPRSTRLLDRKGD